MLPLWRDRLFIAVQPGRVVLTRHTPFRQQQRDSEILSCALDDPLASWAGAVALLSDALTDKRWRNTRVTLVLSNHFVRYAVIPWEAALTSETEIQLYARHQFNIRYGEQAQRWDIRVSPAAQGQARLASAIDEALMARLRELTTVHLYSIQPFLMAAFNHWASKLDRLNFWFATAEHDRLALALIRDGQWSSLRNRQLTQSLTLELPELLDQEALLTGQLPGKSPVFIYAPAHGRITLPPGGRWDIISASDVLPATNSDLTMALSGRH